MKTVSININHKNVKNIIDLLSTDNLKFSINDWINTTSTYTDYYDTHNHCGTAACIVGHMHIAGVVHITKLKDTNNYRLLGRYITDDIIDDRIAWIVGTYLGNSLSYHSMVNTSVHVNIVLDRLSMFMTNTHLNISVDHKTLHGSNFGSVMSCVHNGLSTTKHENSTVQFETRDNKLGLSLNKL